MAGLDLEPLSLDSEAFPCSLCIHFCNTVERGPLKPQGRFRINACQISSVVSVCWCFLVTPFFWLQDNTYH